MEINTLSQMFNKTLYLVPSQILGPMDSARIGNRIARPGPKPETYIPEFLLFVSCLRWIQFLSLSAATASELPLTFAKTFNRLPLTAQPK